MSLHEQHSSERKDTCLGDSQMQTGHIFVLSASATLCSHLLPKGTVAEKSHKLKPKEWLFPWAGLLSPAALDFPLLKSDVGTFGIKAAAA